MKNKTIGIISWVALLGLPIFLKAQNQSVPSISTMEIFNIEDQTRQVVFEENDHFEAPNWSPDGTYLLYNSHGLLYTYDLQTGQKEQLLTDFANNINNDHGISADGNTIVISHSPEGEGSKVYTLPAEGGVPTLITPLHPSYWHGWSPDGQTFAYVAMRDGDFDIYTINVQGGEEIRLTHEPGLDDGPDYSPDGKVIYYNSFQTGVMEIWQMNADGSEKLQLTDDRYSNWFPHPSPDGQWIVYIAYEEDQQGNHPPMKSVLLRLLDVNTKEIQTLCRFTGGQGTINVPSWSPDSKKFAFVSYQ
jgi:Tol biopolymer transport system component